MRACAPPASLGKTSTSFDSGSSNFIDNNFIPPNLHPYHIHSPHPPPPPKQFPTCTKQPSISKHTNTQTHNTPIQIKTQKTIMSEFYSAPSPASIQEAPTGFDFSYSIRNQMILNSQSTNNNSTITTPLTLTPGTTTLTTQLQQAQASQQAKHPSFEYSSIAIFFLRRQKSRGFYGV